MFGMEVEMKQKRHLQWHPILVGTMTCLLLVIIIVGVSYRVLSTKLQEDNYNNTGSAKEYSYHYGFIAADSQDSYWKSVYEAAREAGEEQDIYVEYIGQDLAEEYSVQDYMRIAIASKVDGILLSASGADVEAEIEEATNKGIPVVTMLTNSKQGGETSFVGVNSYDLGKKYGEQIVTLAPTDKSNVCVLLNTKEKTVTQKMILSGIQGALKNTTIKMDTLSIPSTKQFEVEKVIRELLLRKTNVPDIIVCLSASDTIYTYQSVIDYNKVGQIQIVGSYVNDEIQNAIDKGIIASAITVKSDELGTQALATLKEWKDTGTVNEYQTVKCYTVTK